MGWSSNRDPLQELTLKFPTLEDAIKFAHENGVPERSNNN
jgi:hypothetical protein